MIRFFKTQPVFVFGFLELVIGALVAGGVIDPELGGSLSAILAFLAASPKLGVVWNAVTPVETVKDTVTDAATQVLSRASSNAAGKVGEVTDAGRTIVQDVVQEVLG